MATFQCICGKVLSNTKNPNEYQLRVYSDYEWEEMLNMENINGGDIPDPQYDVWKCTECERVYVFNNNRVLLRYVIEEDNR